MTPTEQGQVVRGDQEAPVPAAEAWGGGRQHRGGQAAGEQRQTSNFPPRSCEETALASSCFEEGGEHADKSGGVKEVCPMSDFNLKTLYKNYLEFFSVNVIDLFRYFCFSLSNIQQRTN